MNSDVIKRQSTRMIKLLIRIIGNYRC